MPVATLRRTLRRAGLPSRLPVRLPKPRRGREGQQRRPRVVRRAPSLTGTAFAVLFFALAQTPSLLPRSWVLQGAVAGVSAAIGYGIGATLGAAGRPVARRLAPSTQCRTGRRICWAVVLLVSGAAVVTALLLGRAWQREVRAVLGMAAPESWHATYILVLAACVVVGLVLVARTLRLGTRSLQRVLRRVAPGWLASALGGLIAAVLVGGAIQGMLLDSFFETAETSAALANDTTPPGVVQPVSPTRSGSPESLVEWSTLGSKGQELVASGPTPQQLAAFSGEATQEPIRVYVGVESAPDIDQRVRLAMAELDRTNAWDRSVLLVATATGTGWVNPQTLAAVEYLTGGDSAVVSLQYGYLPSWISVLVDGSPAAEAGVALTRAVQERWQQLPRDARPRLLVYGESLGSLGAESAFSDLDDVVATTDGALFVGPTSANPLWGQLVSQRRPGSPVWLPDVGQGGRVVFADRPDDLPGPGADPPDVVYLQNSSDPVVWWSPQLLWDRPPWLDGERGPDVSPSMRWYPVVTFWQVVVDLASAAEDMPAGHGHRYGPEIVQALVTLLAPPEWDADDSARLRAAVLGDAPTG